MRFCLTVFPLAALLAASLPSQSEAPRATERLVQDGDTAMRKQAEATLTAGLSADKQKPGANDEAAAKRRLADLRVLCAEAMAQLPDASRAQMRASLAIEDSAKKEQQAGPAKAADALRLALAELASDLAFAPVKEADLPKGFQEFAALDELELRDYPAYRMVRAPMKGAGSMGSFWMLFNHIKKNEIAMTAPVQVDYDESSDQPREQSMAFLYGDPAMGSAGADGKVEVVDVPKMTALSVGARGYERKDRVADMHERLLHWLSQHADQYEAAGSMRLMNYNSPSVRDERRYFEVQIPVRRVEKDAVKKDSAPSSKS